MRTFVKDIVRSVTGNLARFLAILGIVAIGAGVYAGLRAFVPDMYLSADAFYDGQDFADLQVISALGLTDDDVEAVLAVDGVAEAMGVASYETVMSDAEGSNLQVQIEALPMGRYVDGACADEGCAISRLVVRQGRLPLSPGEIAFSSNGHLKPESVKVGDRIAAREVMGVGDAGAVFGATEFVVVGIVSSPEWLSVSTGLSPTSGARVTNYAYVDRSSLVDPDLFTAVIATVEGAAGQTSFTDAYDDVVLPVRDAVKAAAPKREDARYKELLDAANGAVEQAQGLSDAAGGIELALRLVGEPTDVRELLDGPLFGNLVDDSSRERLLETLEGLSETGVMVSREGVSIDGAEPVGVTELATAALDAATAARDSIEPARWYVLTRDANPSYYVYKATAQRMDRICLIFPVFFFLVAALVSLTTMGRMVANDRVEIGTLAALGYSRRAIAGKYLAFSGAAAVLGAVSGIAVGSYALPYAIWTPYSVMYLEMPFYLGIRLPSAAVALVLSCALAIVATLAAVWSVLGESAASLLLPAAPKSGRRILLERAAFVWRRMGFSQKVAARNVFRYKARMAMTVAGVAGCCGLMLCGFGVQNKLDGFVEAQYGGIYAYDLQAVFDGEVEPGAAAGSADSPLAAALDDVLGPGRWTFLLKRACVAANPAGDPARVPYGVGGRLDKTGGSVQAELRAARSDATSDDAGILRDAAVYVFPDGANRGFIEMKGLDGEEVDVPRLIGQDGASAGRGPDALPGAVLTQRLAEQLMVGVGDEFEVALDEGGAPARLRVGAIMRNFVGHFVYMSPDAYRAAFGLEDDDALGYNLVLAFAPQGHGIEPDSHEAALLKERVLAADGALTSVTLALEESDGYEDIAKSLNSIVAILLGVSGMLAFIVVYALTEINIEERRREIATLKVLGFTRPEVRGYVYRETYVLAGIGIACGLPFGAWLCDFVMRSAEFDNVIYFRTVAPWCYAAAVALTAAVVVLVTVAMRRELDSIEMVASLKSVD